jgi:predicted glycosyltransferase
MRILIDVNHPAHVHLFRNAAEEWQSKGYPILWVARDKDIVVDLLKLYGIQHLTISTHQRGAAALAWELFARDWKLYQVARRFRPNLMLGTSVNITHIARFVGAKSIFFTESDPHLIRLITYLAFPFADKIVVPDVLPDIGWPSKQVKHNSYHKLAYLHPLRFQADPTVLDEMGVQTGETFFIIRLIGWGASHDLGNKGLDLAGKRRLVNTLRARGRVFISSEEELQAEFAPYRLTIQPHRMHDALAFATLLVGDSQSMTTEAALLGTPAIRCNSMVGRTTVIDELEHKYHLCYGYQPNQLDAMLERIHDLLCIQDLK